MSLYDVLYDHDHIMHCMIISLRKTWLPGSCSFACVAVCLLEQDQEVFVEKKVNCVGSNTN